MTKEQVIAIIRRHQQPYRDAYAGSDADAAPTLNAHEANRMILMASADLINMILLETDKTTLPA